MRTWIIGDSMVRRAGVGQTQLKGGGRVMWSGIGGAKIAGVCNRLIRFRKNKACPTTLILHLGTNDIFASKIHEIRQQVSLTLTEISNLFPMTRIIWSMILPRRYFDREQVKGAGAAAIRNINKHATRAARSMGIRVIFHARVFPLSSCHLFARDGLHPSEEGLNVFRKHLEEALVFFNTFPGQLEYPELSSS